ncbi:NUDIX hydrolase [Candidatus Litorirhabdus singularis]|uniref:NUDIX hydrolase n=1 Tax=Candidatus Litorirhabdus singularis TaxID=2518993 RepID=UPI0024331979|nr:CoA pyrophosphatase [Candidatus Litorirhabdus singularis]
MTAVNLATIEHKLSRYKHRKKLARPLLKRSAVAMILREDESGLRILMIKRAERDGDPWSGHMAFPGGRMEQIDRHGYDVAVRETEEEIGLALTSEDRCIGRFSEIMTHAQLRRRPMVVSPYVFRLDRHATFEPNYEVAEVVWIPMDYLLDLGNRERMVWNRGKVEIPLSCYMYNGYRIWGLSLMMIDEMLAMLGRKPGLAARGGRR